MAERKAIAPISFNPEKAREEIERDREAAKANKAVLENMRLATGCTEMSRIVGDILVPEFLSAVHAMRKSGHRAEVVAFDAENPVYTEEMVDILETLLVWKKNASGNSLMLYLEI